MPADQFGAFDAEAPQNGVDQPLMRQKTAAMRQIDTRRHRRVRRGAQKQQLRDAETQDVMNRRRTRRQRGAEARRNQRIDLTEPSQRGRDEQAGECPVSSRQQLHCRIVVDRVVERALAAEHRTEELERNISGGRQLGHQGSSET